MLRMAGLILILSATAAHASAVTVFGSSEGRDCYLAASVGVGSASGIESCDRAIGGGGLVGRDLAGTYTNRGILHLQSGNPDAAMADFNKAIDIKGNLAEAILNRGNAHYHRRDYVEAINDYTRAIDMDTSDLHAAHFNRGLAHERQGNKDAALADFKQANQISPDWIEAQKKLAQYNEVPAPRN